MLFSKLLSSVGHFLARYQRGVMAYTPPDLKSESESDVDFNESEPESHSPALAAPASSSAPNEDSLPALAARESAAPEQDNSPAVAALERWRHQHQAEAFGSWVELWHFCRHQRTIVAAAIARKCSQEMRCSFWLWRTISSSPAVDPAIAEYRQRAIHRFEQRVATRQRHQMSSACLLAWRTTTSTSILRRNTWVSRTLRHNFTAWHGYSRAHNRLRRSLGRIMHRRAAGAFAHWRRLSGAAISERQRRSNLARRIVRRMSQLLLARGLAAWCEQHHRRRRQHALLERTARRIVGRRQAAAMAGWHQYGRRVTLCRSATLHLQHRTASRSFRTWAACAQHLRREHVLVGRALARLRARGLYRACVAWHAYAVIRRREMVAMGRQLQRLTNRRMWMAWSRWVSVYKAQTRHNADLNESRFKGQGGAAVDDEYARMITIVTQTEERTRIMEERARKMSDILAKKAWQVAASHA